MQKNDYLIAKFGVDTAENEPLQIWGVIQFNIQFTPYQAFAAMAADRENRVVPLRIDLATAAPALARWPQGRAFRILAVPMVGPSLRKELG